MAQTNLSEIAISTDPSNEIILGYECVLKETSVDGEVTQLLILENQQIPVHYVCLCEIWNRNEIIIDDVFVFVIAAKFMKSDGVESRSVDECQRSTHW